MGVSLLATLDDANQRRLLEVEKDILSDVFHALVKAKVCAKPRRGGRPVAAVEGLQDIFAWLTAELDATKIERKFSAIVRIMPSRNERAWFEGGKPTRIAILWLIACMTIARLSQLDALVKPSPSMIAATSDMMKILAEMANASGNDGSDCLQVRGFIKALTVCVVASVPLRDKAYGLKIFESFQLRIEDVLVTLNSSPADGKAKSSAIEFCRAWISSAPLPIALQAMKDVLKKCATTSGWHRPYNDLVSGRPLLAALLVEDIDSISENKIGDASYRRFGLENLITGIRAVDNVVTTTVDRLVCTALHDQDVQLRALAWKTLGVSSSKMSRGDRNRLLVVACDAFFIERARSVGATILKLLVNEDRLHGNTAASPSFDTCTGITTRVQEFLLCLMSQRGGDFPSSWTQDAVRLLTQGWQSLRPELVLKSFSTGTKEGQQTIATTYREYLVYLGETDARRELQRLARCIGLDTVTVFEKLIQAVCKEGLTGEPTNKIGDSRASSGNFTLPATRFEGSCARSRQDLCSSIFLESAVCRALAVATSRLEALCEASAQLLQAVSGVLAMNHEDDRTEREAFAALRGFRVVIELDTNANLRYVAAVESAFQTRLAILVTYPTLQREIVKLLYLFARPQEKAYWCLALSQDDAFVDIAKLASFITLVGVIASENAQYLTMQQLHRQPRALTENFDDDGEQRREGGDYMEHFQDSLALKNRIKNVKEASISDGLLSAYLPMIDRALDSSDATKVKVAATWTLGEFMKISPVVTEAYFGKLLKILRTNGGDPAVTMACIDVWHTLQPTMKPSRTKEEGVEIIYQLIINEAKDNAVVTHALKCLQLLVLHAQLRDDRLYLFSPFLLSPNRNAKVITQRFFRSFFRQHPPAKASSTIFEVYFALVGNSRTKSLANEIATSLMELINEGSDSLASLENALTDELDSGTRCNDALHLLAQFNVLSVPTVQWLIGSIDRLICSPSKDQNRVLLEQMFMKQLQRTKEKSEKEMIKDAISKLKGQPIGGDATQQRRVPLNVISIERLVHNLRA